MNLPPTNTTDSKFSQIDDLIKNKLEILVEENQLRLTDSNVTSDKYLNKRIVELLQEDNLSAIYLDAGLKTYQQRINDRINSALELQSSAWEAIKSILEKSKYPVTKKYIIETIQKYTWESPDPSQIFKYQKKDRFITQFNRRLSSYGISDRTREEALNKKIDHEYSIASVKFSNMANSQWRKVLIEIDEFVLYNDLRTQSSTSSLNNIQNNEDFNCLPNLPPIRPGGGWVEVIYTMTQEFWNESQRCPTVIEAWERIRNNPPKNYGVVAKPVHKEDSICMGSDCLGKRAFQARWKRYNKSH